MEQKKNLRYYWRILLARKHYFLWPVLIVFLLSVFVTVVLPSTYESRCTILVQEQQIAPEFVKDTITGVDERIQTLTHQILSRTKLWEIIEKFNLYPQMRKNATKEEVVERMRTNIQVMPISSEITERGRGSGVTIAFSIAYRGGNPETTQKVTETLASLYLQENTKIRQEQVKTTTKFLEEELKKIDALIADIGNKISIFKAKHEGLLPELNQFNLSQAERLEKEIQTVDNQIHALQDRKISLYGQMSIVKPDTPIISTTGERVMDPDSRMHYLQVQLADLRSKFSPEHPDVVKARREMAELEKLVGKTGGKPSLKRQKATQLKAELAELQGRYSDQHPEVIKLKKQIEKVDAETQLDSPVRTVTQPENPAYINLLTNIKAVDNDISMYRKQRGDLVQTLKMYRQRLEKAPLIEQEYLALTREYERAQLKHQEVMSKILEAHISESMVDAQKGEKFTLIEPPSLPEKPVSPNRLLLFTVGVILSLGSGVAGVTLIENWDHTVKGADELIWATGLPVLGRISLIETAEDKAWKIKRRLLVWSFAAVSLLLCLLVIHFFIMDLWIFAAKVPTSG
jgi:polysaccharide biosynthesis transport protein